MRFFTARPRRTIGFGARIGAGFAVVLVVVISGYAIALSTTESFSDAIELLRRTDEAGGASVRVGAAVDHFEAQRSDASALAVETELAALLQRLDDLSAFVRDTGREGESLLAARRAAEHHRELFRRLRSLDQSRRQHLDSMAEQLRVLDASLSEIGRFADVAFVAARQRVEQVDVARNQAANAADHANAMMVALASLRQIEAQLIGGAAVDVAGAIELAEARFEQLFAAIPSLQLELPSEVRTLRKFERWLGAYRQSLLRTGRGNQVGARTLKTAAVLLQTESNNLYRSAVQRYEDMQAKAREARVQVNAASDALSLASLVQIELSGLRSNHASLSENRPQAFERAAQLLTQLRERIAPATADSAGVDDWWPVLERLAGYRGELAALTIEAGDYWDAMAQMTRSRQAMEQLIAAVAAGERARVEAQRQRGQDVLLLTAIGAMLLSIAIAGWITRHLAGELGRLSERMYQLAGGQRDIDIPYLQREDQTGNMARALAVFRDNAEALDHYQQDLEQLVAERTAELEGARRRAEHLARVKSEFLANMSHEIRTPLNAVLGLAQVGVRNSSGRRDSQGGGQGGGQSSARTFGQILESGQHLLGVINDILDFSKLEAGKLVVLSEPFALRGTIEEAVALTADNAADCGIELCTELSEDLPAWVSGDALRLRQVLLNLLNNAVKFTERGRVRLSARRDGERVIFEIADTGIGMSPAQVVQLFKPFEQADGSTTRKFGGTGLGLAISDNLAQLMGGEIGVSSLLGEGSVFTLTLPLPETEAVIEAVEDGADSVPPPGRRLCGVRLLVVDDVELNRFIAEELLAPEGAELTLASDGGEAVAAVASGGAAAFDAVMMDVQMPGMDGHEATRRILELAPALPVIGVTAHALAEERERCLASGMRDHVTKPIDLDRLVGAIRRQLPRAPRVEASTPPEVTPVIEETAEAATREDGGLIDWPALSLRFNGKRKLIDKLVGMVLRDHAESAAKLRRAAAAGDWEAVGFIAHKLKNVGGTLESRALFELSPVVELAAKEQAGEAAELAGELARLTDQLLAELAVASDLPQAG